MLSEIASELRTVLLGRASIADGVLPPIVFGLVNAFAGPAPAAAAAVATAITIVIIRLRRGNSVKFALAGLGGVAIAATAALVQGPEGFFLPSIVSAGGTAVLIIASIVARRPFVAWTSWIARDWPLSWYWHPRVRPAYTQASWIWAAFFTVRALGQWATLDDIGSATAFRVIAGWPSLIVLLVVTYSVGRRRLVRLAGPSVDEYVNGEPKPWEGQQSGF
jgi:hypothetical protein